MKSVLHSPPQPTPNTVTLERVGAGLVIDPPCGDILQSMMTVEHVAVNNPDKGFCITAEPRALSQLNITMAGLEPCVTHLLERRGFKVKAVSPRKKLPEPLLEEVKSYGPVDYALLNTARQRDRAIIRYGQTVDPAWLIAQLALAYPEQSIMVFASTKAEVGCIASRLRQRLPESVTTVKQGTIAADPRQIAIGTYQAMLGGCMDIDKRDLFIAVDAINSLGSIGVQALRAVDNARVIGFLPDDIIPSPREEAWLRCFYGFHDIYIPAHGHKWLPVDVISHQITGGRAIQKNVDELTLYRQGIWHNSLRNRRIAAIGRSFYENAPQNLKQLCPSIKGLDYSHKQRVAILVANIEHGLQLARKLRGWPLFTAPEVNTKGMSSIDRKILRGIRSNITSFDTYGIFTPIALKQIDLQAIDVLIRADSSNSLPPLRDKQLIIPNTSNNRLLLVDTDDQFHPDLARYSRDRRRAYRNKQWYSPATDPVEQRVIEFIASRPRG